MALTMSSQLVIRGIRCTLTMLLVLSVQAIDYEVHRNDVTPKLNGNIILTNRDLLEQLNLVEPKESYTLQEGTERLLYFGALLRARLLDTFGSLLYINYDDFSIAEVRALHKIYQEIFERRYNVFNLVPAILKNPDTRPSKICAGIYIHAEPCLKSSASICHRIRPQHDLPHPEDLSTPALNVTYLAYRLSKISRQYLGGFSLAALLKLLQREVLTITPDLLSGLLYNVRYDNFDDDVRLAERELVQSFRKIAQITKIPLPLPTMELKKFRTVNSFLKYYINIYAEKLSDDDLKRHAFLIGKRIVDDVGTIDENIYLLGNVYENRMINIKYLFDLVLPDDVLDNDIIEAKKYLVKKLNEFNVVEKYLKVQKYQQATPLQLTMEITGQLKDIDFAKSIAISLRIHARFWRSSRMLESLDELLELFDAYENLRQVPLYDDMMQKIDSIKENLWAMKNISVEILCNAPRACLQIGLQSLLYCRYVSFEIKELIRDFFKLSNMCVIPMYVTQEVSSRRSVNIPFKLSRTRFSKVANISAIWNFERKLTKIKPTTSSELTTTQSSTTEDNSSESESSESSVSEETTESVQISNESTESTESIESTEVSTEAKTTSEESTENTTTTTVRTTEHVEPILTTTIMDKTSTIQEETTTVATSTTAMTTTVSPTTTTTLPTTITSTTSPTIITTTLPSTTTLSTTTTTMLPTATTTTSPTITTTSPTTTTTSPTITTTSPTTITSSTTTTTSPTITTTSPTITTTSPTTITTLPTTTLPTTTITLPTRITTIGPTTTTTLPTTTITSILFTTITARTELPIRMKLKYSKIKKKKNMFIHNNGETTQSSTSVTTSASTRSCESNECSSEQSSEKTNEETMTTPASTLESTRTTSPELSTTSQNIATVETTVTSTTESSETSVTKEECKSKSESIETSGTSCETSCDSVVEDCDDSVIKDTSEKVENHTVKCSKVRCKENSPEISSDCETETDKSCECVSKEEKSAECMTLCRSDVDSSSCEEKRNDCSKSEMPTINMKLEHTRKRIICEIRDPHHRRQMRRLAKMRAISAALAMSHTDVLGSKAPRHRNRIASKKLYNLLAAKISHAKDGKSSRIAEYLLKRPFRLSRIGAEAASRKHRKQQEQVYKLRRRLVRKLRRKLTGRTSMHRSSTPLHQSQIKRISRKDAKLITAATDQKGIQD